MQRLVAGFRIAKLCSKPLHNLRLLVGKATNFYMQDNQPSYERDDGRISDAAAERLRKFARAALPNGAILRKQTLFSEDKAMGSRALKRILSLDVDGVLHPDPRLQPRHDVATLAWLDHLVPLLAAHPDVGLLVHSSWRETYTAAELQDMLHPLEERFAGVAPPGEKGLAIATWKRAHAPDALMLAIDDDLELQVQPGIEVLHCDPRTGLSGPGAQRAIMEWLKRTTE